MTILAPCAKFLNPYNRFLSSNQEVEIVRTFRWLTCGFAALVVMGVVVAGCGKDDKKLMPMPTPPQNAAAAPQPLPTDGRFQLVETVNSRYTVTQVFTKDHLKSCRIERDTVSRRMVLMVKFFNPSNNTGIDIKIVTRASAFEPTREDLIDSHEVYGLGEGGSRIEVASGLAQGSFTNSLREFENKAPIASICRASYTVSSAGAKGQMICENLMSPSDERVSGTLKFSCGGETSPSQPTTAPRTN